MLKIHEIHNECVGCTACMSICPTACINMKIDNEGFLYPEVDSDKCIACNKCEKVCPVINQKINNFEKQAFYGWHKNDEIRYNSSSGGAFAAIAKKVLDDNGIVYGAIFDEQTKSVIHKNTDEVSLKRLQKSKCVESGLSGTFKEVKSYIKQGRKVLVSGTPCQIAGLHAFIGHPDNLQSCDFVCHGVPSAAYFKSHLESIEKKHRNKVKNVDFRPKKRGWSANYIDFCITFTNNKVINIPFSIDSYYRGFVTDSTTLRKSCYECKFYNNHAADITLADFWGYRNFKPELNDEKGISLIIANTIKGNTIIQNIEDEFNLNKLDMEYAKYVHTRKDYSKLKSGREQFFKLASKYGFEKAANMTYFKNGTYNIAKYKLKRFIKNILGKS